MTATDKMIEAMGTRGWYVHRVHDGPYDMFQVLGERGCGTNVVRKSISKSMRLARSEALGWKHGFPTMVAIPRSMIVVCAFRSAFDWAVSFYKRPWHASIEMQALGFSEFLRAPWDGIVDRTSDFEMIHPELNVDNHLLQFDRHPITGEVFDNIFALRAAKTRALLGLMQRDCNVVYVQLEAMNANPRAFVDEMRETFQLPPTERGYRPITRQMGNAYRASVKDREPAPASWSAEDYDWVMSQLDPEVEAALGYTYEPAAPDQ